MTKVDIFSGFLGAGKTTLIKKLIADGYNGQKIVIIENEFGQIGIDSGFLKESGIQITEMNSGCICCSLVGDFGKALAEVITTYDPDRILIEPSGVGKLSDVVAAVEKCEGTDILGKTTIIDASKCKIYLKNFKEFYENQISNASTIVLSRTSNIKEAKLNEAIELIKGINPNVQIITTPWEQLSGKAILDAIEKPSHASDMASDMIKEMHEEHEHHHHDHEHGEECTCGCHDHDHEHEEHEQHHHHEHGEECTCGCHDHDHEHEHHHHDHDHGEGCTCGCHDHDHEGHHHHHADEVFDSIGFETAKLFNKDEIEKCLDALLDDEKYGMVLRAKGIVAGDNGEWIHFDYVPGENNVRNGAADITGKLCIIGSNINKSAIKELFGIN